MRKSPTRDIEQYRVLTGPLKSHKSDGANGAFLIPCGIGVCLNVICSDGKQWAECGLDGPPWEHVSVSLVHRCPTWNEMDFVKGIFWKDDECVIQFHVPRSEHINCNPNCLHLWKPIGVEIPRPPGATVGPKS